jgi:hypothetical protein
MLFLLHVGVLLLCTKRWRKHVPLKCQLTFNGLNDIIITEARILHSHRYENLRS